MGFSQSKSDTGFSTQQFPGLFGDKKGAELGGYIERLLKMQSPFQQSFERSVLSPEFGATTLAENELLNELTSLTGGAAATRGLGAPTPAALSETLAPTLIDLRQKEVENLRGGAEFDQSRRMQSIQALLELAGLSMPQVVGGQTGSSRSFGFTPPTFNPFGGPKVA